MPALHIPKIIHPPPSLSLSETALPELYSSLFFDIHYLFPQPNQQIHISLQLANVPAMTLISMSFQTFLKKSAINLKHILSLFQDEIILFYFYPYRLMKCSSNLLF